MASKTRKRTYRKKRTTKLATKKYVKQMISKDVETKYFDIISSVALAPSANGTIVRLTGVAQGTTDSQRVGDKLTMRAFRIRLQFGVADTYNMLRMIIFQWYPNTTLVAPSVAAILQQPAGTLTSFLSFPVHDYSNQFQILSDKILYTDSVRNQQVTITKKIRMKYVKKTINFSAATNEGSNHLYILLMSDSTAVTDPAVNFQGRLWYDDS